MRGYREITGGEVIWKTFVTYNDALQRALEALVDVITCCDESRRILCSPYHGRRGPPRVLA